MSEFVLTPEKLADWERTANGPMGGIGLRRDEVNALIAAARERDVLEAERDMYRAALIKHPELSAIAERYIEVRTSAAAASYGAEVATRLLDGEDPNPRPYAGLFGGQA